MKEVIAILCIVCVLQTCEPISRQRLVKDDGNNLNPNKHQKSLPPPVNRAFLGESVFERSNADLCLSKTHCPGNCKCSFEPGMFVGLCSTC